MGKRASMVGFGSGVMMAGIAMILHAAMAIMKHRTELKALDIQFTTAPWNVVIECCLGMALCVLGTSSSGAKLQPVFAKRECAERCENTECGGLLSHLSVWSRSYDKSIGAVSLMTF